MANVGGKPPKYKSKEEIQQKIDQYFEDCKGEPLIGADGNPMLDKWQNPIMIGQKPPTVTGLALALGFTGRQALLNYQAKKEFVDTITRAKSRVEEYAESRLFDRDGSNGAQFSLRNNFKGWNDTEEKRLENEREKLSLERRKVDSQIKEDSGDKLDKILQNMDTLYERLKPVPNRDIEDFE